MKHYRCLFTYDGMVIEDDVYAADCLKARSLILDNYEGATHIAVGVMV